MKYITTTANDFVKAEADEHGYDFVDAQFAEGYEPTLVNGIWCWCMASKERAGIDVLHTSDSGRRDAISYNIPNSSCDLASRTVALSVSARRVY